MIILDTNVVSEPFRTLAEPRVIAWLDAQDRSELWLTAITAAELYAGVNKLPQGVRRSALQVNLTAILQDEFAGRILSFDLDAAVFYAEIAGPRLAAKKKVEALDCQIAAIARLHGATIATRNTRHFEDCGVEFIDPWTA